MSEVVLNYTLLNSSPMFNYGPAIGVAANSAQSGWQVDTSSVFFTSDPGSNLSLPLFYGNVLSLYGSAGCTFNVTVDTETTSHSLASSLIFQESLESDFHNFSLTVGPDASSNSELLFDYAVITSTYSLDQPPQEVTYDAQSEALVFSQDWTMLPNGSAETNLIGASVTLNFTGVAVLIAGPSGTETSSGIFAVYLDGLVTFLANNTVGISDTQLYYQGGLDPTQQHTLAIVNSDAWFTLESITVWQTEVSTPSGATTASPSKGHSNIVKIVVPIVAVVAALLVLLAALWMRKRRTRRHRQSVLSGPFARRLARSFGSGKGDAVVLDDIQPKADVKNLESGRIEAGAAMAGVESKA
ncbi:hypothetical protein OBBRIDRAFT_891359 [Obba rivulosa]|uniref:Uncharacterized protein n=1 Tax=Obba rivulosa TaxID=1052685 RepID=A0A8E2DJV3_9APHY|nr:hypothetical protein OBBRIDRAFT_891359 [Obba rivulosa]